MYIPAAPSMVVPHLELIPYSQSAFPQVNLFFFIIQKSYQSYICMFPSRTEEKIPGLDELQKIKKYKVCSPFFSKLWFFSGCLTLPKSVYTFHLCCDLDLRVRLMGTVMHGLIPNGYLILIQCFILAKFLSFTWVAHWQVGRTRSLTWTHDISRQLPHE